MIPSDIKDRCVDPPMVSDKSLRNVIDLPVVNRQCRKCNAVKPLDEYYKLTGLAVSSKNLGHSYACKKCDSEYAKAHRGKLDPAMAVHRRARAYKKMKSDPDRYADHRAMKNRWNRSEKYYERYYQRRFGISLEQVQKMLQVQNGLCANIGCSKPITAPSHENKSTFAVDHNHQTGKVRGLLCIRCNCMLGHIEKNLSLVPGMMNYLNLHRTGD